VVWTVEQGPIGLVLLLPSVLLLTGSLGADPVGYASADDAARAMDDPVLPVSRAARAAKRRARRNTGRSQSLEIVELVTAMLTRSAAARYVLSDGELAAENDDAFSGRTLAPVTRTLRTC
jgi:hypothetical protein